MFYIDEISQARLTLTRDILLQDIRVLAAHLQFEPVKVFPRLAHRDIVPGKGVRRQVSPVLVELGTLDDEPDTATVLILGFGVEEIHGLVYGIDEFPTRNRKAKGIDKVDEFVLVVQLGDGLGVLDERLASSARLDRHGLGRLGIFHLGGYTADGEEEVDVMLDGERDERVGILGVLGGG